MNERAIDTGLPFIVGAVAAVRGLVVLAGWALGIGVLKSIVPGFATMKANTALGFAFLGVALVLRVSCVKRAAWMERLFGSMAFIIGLLTLVEYIFNWNAGIDEFLFRDAHTSFEMYPGRPSQMTAFGLFILGGALITDSVRPVRRLTEWLSIVALLVAFVGFVGYILNVNTLYGATLYNSMALPTCILLLLVSVAVWWCTHDSGLRKLVCAENSTGIMARWLIPIAVVAPILLSIIWLHGARIGLYTMEFGWALLVVTNVACLVGFVFLIARPMIRIENDRRIITEQLETTNRVLEYRATELDHANKLLETISNTDPLTGVGNRRAFNARLMQEFEMIQRYPTPLSLLLIDLDQYKTYNDRFGHKAGDEVLTAVADVLKEHARKTDFVARIGGDEFAIILTETDMEGAITQAERFRFEIELFKWNLRPVTVSIGIAEVTGAIESPMSLFQAADEALYVAKNSGRNQVYPSHEKRG